MPENLQAITVKAFSGQFLPTIKEVWKMVEGKMCIYNGSRYRISVNHPDNQLILTPVDEGDKIIITSEQLRDTGRFDQGHFDIKLKGDEQLKLSIIGLPHFSEKVWDTTGESTEA